MGCISPAETKWEGYSQHLSHQLFWEVTARGLVKGPKGTAIQTATANRRPLPAPGCLATDPELSRALRWICPDLHLIARGQRRPNLNTGQKIHWKQLKISWSDRREHLKGLLTTLPLLRMSLQADPCFQTWFRQVIHWFQGCSKPCATTSHPRISSLSTFS